MFAVFGIVALLGCVYIRPQEFVAGLDRVPVLYLALAIVSFGAAIDLRMRSLRPVAAPTLWWMVALVLWIVATVFVNVPADDVSSHLTLIGVSFALYFAIAHAGQSLRALETMAGAIAVLALVLSFVGIHQGLAPLGCVLLDESNPRERRTGTFDGRSCEVREDCGGPEAEPDGAYACEHIGMFGTNSADGRVRYRGVLQDPNELALAVSCALPLLFGIAGVRRQRRWRLVAAVGALATAACVVMTQSRSGQLVFLAVLGTYFVRRVGTRAVPVILALCVPVLLLGGRDGAEATISAELRLESWRTALDLAKTHPILGVGQGMFVEHHFLTAHNSYMLAAAELGVLGMVLWSIPVYLSVKIPWTALRELRAEPAARAARVWAMALLASMAGLLTGMLFLSLAYHAVLWIHLGLAGALSLAVARHRPGWRVGFGAVDLAIVVALDAAFLAASSAFLRLQGF